MWKVFIIHARKSSNFNVQCSSRLTNYITTPILEALLKIANEDTRTRKFERNFGWAAQYRALHFGQSLWVKKPTELPQVSYGTVSYSSTFFKFCERTIMLFSTGKRVISFFHCKPPFLGVVASALLPQFVYCFFAPALPFAGQQLYASRTVPDTSSVSFVFNVVQ